MALKRINAADFVKSEHPPGSKASYPAMPVQQNEQRFYLATIPVEDLFPFCFLTRRDEDPALGFQRVLAEDRALDISRYLDNSNGSIPTNIVLSAQENAELSYERKTKSIKFRRAEKAFLVLDGQHRLFGYGLTKKKHRVPVAIYEGLSRATEASLFIDINTSQRGVPAALLLDIKQVAERENDAERELRKLFDQLSGDKDGPFHGYLSAHQSVSGKISRVTFNRGMHTLLDNAILGKISEAKRYVLIRNYFTAVAANLTNKSLLLKSSYFEAFCGTFGEVLALCHANHGNYTLTTLQDTLAPLSRVDIAGIVTAGQTSISKTTIIPVIKSVLTSNVAVSDDMIGN